MEKISDSAGLLLALICTLLIAGALVAVLGKTLYRLMDLFTAQARSVPTAPVKAAVPELAQPVRHSCWHCGNPLSNAPINEIALSESESYRVYRCDTCHKTQALPTVT